MPFKFVRPLGFACWASPTGSFLRASDPWSLDTGAASWKQDLHGLQARAGSSGLPKLGVGFILRVLDLRAWRFWLRL